MNVNDMVAAMAAKTVDAMVNVEPYNAIAEADGIANTLVDFYSFDKLPVFMAATPEFVDEEPGHRGRLSQGLARRRRRTSRTIRRRSSDTIYTFYTSKGYKMAPETFAKAIARVEVGPGWPADIKPYMQKQAEMLLAAKKIKAIPDWNKALRKEFLKQASA